MVNRKPARLDRDSPVPLWAQLHQDLVRRLASGTFRSGFPGEHELVQTYGVSRYTVREALRRLREDGTITSSRGRPTTVADLRIEQPLGSLYSLFREVESRGVEQTSVVLAQSCEHRPEAAAELGLSEDSEMFHLERLRLAAGDPLAHDEVWLPAEVARPLLDADFTRAGLYDELATRCGVRVTGGRERIRAIAPTTAQRQLLHVPRGVACLAIQRIGRARTGQVEYRRTIVRGDRFDMIAEWTSHGYSLGATPRD
ncbi:MAG: GntR family transcriptional regulator [Kineosporiaceae bacterium]